MKKIIPNFLLVIFAALVFTACSNDVPERAEDINKQTILVFMPWSGSASNTGLYNIFLQNLDSIESAIKKDKGLKGRVMVLISKSTSVSDLYEIKYANGVITHVPVKSYSGNSYTTAAGITEIINDVKTNAYALNYAMMVGCHGSGWTYKEDWVNYPINAKRHSSVYDMSQAKASPYSNQSSTAYPMTRFFGSVDDMSYATNVTTFAEGIQNSGLKMQFIQFDDCYMANIETAYELRNATNFLIASTSEVMDLGVPYHTIWKSLATAIPSYDGAVKAFDTFYRAYKYPYGALSAIDCRKVEALAATMKQINTHYTLPDSLVDSVQVLDGFNPAIFYDMGNYVDHQCKNANLLDEFHSRLDAVVPNKSTTDQLYSYLYWNPIIFDVKHYSGITISDPSRNSVAIKGRQKTGWWQATH